MVDPFGVTLPAVITIATGGGTSAVGIGTQIANLIAARPLWIAHLASVELANGTASTAPIWRWVRMPSQLATRTTTIAVRGTSMAATMQGVAGLSLTLGVPIVVAVGVWVMMGSGYAEARKIVRRRAFMSGFSQGFTMGVLKWNWEQAVYAFAKRFVIHKNTFDGVADREEVEGYNEGLHKGYGVGSGAERTFYFGRVEQQSPVVERVGVKKTGENAKKDVRIDVGKNYRIALRKLAGRTDSGPWSKNWDEARLQQRNYVIELAAAGLKHGLIVPD